MVGGGGSVPSPLCPDRDGFWYTETLGMVESRGGRKHAGVILFSRLGNKGGVGPMLVAGWKTSRMV